MRIRRSTFGSLLNWLAILLIVVVTASALLAGATILGSNGLPGNGLSPGEFVSSGEVTMTDGPLYLDRTGQPAIVGEINNDKGEPITNVTVSVTIYENGEEVDTRETIPLAATIPDGTTIPYEIRFDANADPDEYTTNVSYDAGSHAGESLDLADSQEDSVSQDSVTISGSITNVGDTTAARPTAIVTFYDENGTVIGARTDHISPLEPDGTGEFTVRYSTLGNVPSLAREYETYEVVVVDLEID